MLMGFLFVLMAVESLLPMAKNEDKRIVQTVLHTIAFDDYLETLQIIF